MDLRNTLSYNAEGLAAIGNGNYLMEELVLQLPPKLLFSQVCVPMLLLLTLQIDDIVLKVNIHTNILACSGHLYIASC